MESAENSLSETSHARSSRLADDEVDQIVIETVAKVLDLDVAEVSLSSSLTDELGAESLDYLDIAFSLEGRLGISFPRTDIFQRALEHFGTEALWKNDQLTPFAIQLLRRSMPELEPEAFGPGVSVERLRAMFRVSTLARLAKLLLAAKAAMPRTCERCGGQMRDSPVLPELACASCSAVVPIPSGDEIASQDLIEIGKKLQAAGADGRQE